MELTLHPKTQSNHLHQARNFTIAADARVDQQGQIRIEYRCSGARVSDLTAQFQVDGGKRKDELWKQTCFEAFILPLGGDAYFELNVALSGDWNLYAFDSYRRAMRTVELPNSPLTQINILSENEFLLNVLLDGSTFLSKNQQALKLGITAVVCYPKLGLGPFYFAAHHAGDQPDFHLKESFIYDPIRD